MTLDHLEPGIRHLVDKPIQERVYDLWPRLFVKTPQVTAIYGELDRLYYRGNQERSSILLIWGEPNVGKTSILSRYVRLKLKESADSVSENHYAQVPTFIVSMPVGNNKAEFYELILSKLGVAYNPYSSPSTQSVQARRLMQKQGVRLPIFDEIHNVVPLNADTKDEMLRTIKELSNKIQRPLVFAGTGAARDFISQSKELRERYYEIQVTRFAYDDRFKDFLETIEHIIPLRKPSGLSEPRLRKFLYDFSGGLIGTLNELLFQATVTAIQNEDERITKDNLAGTIYAQNVRLRMGVRRTLAKPPNG